MPDANEPSIYVYFVEREHGDTAFGNYYYADPAQAEQHLAEIGALWDAHQAIVDQINAHPSRITYIQTGQSESWSVVEVRPLG